MRNLVDLAIERIHLAGMGDIDWNDALSAVTRALHVERAMLFTPELGPEAGGIAAVFDVNAVPQALRSVCASTSETDESHSMVLSDGGDRSMPPTLFIVLRQRSSAGMTAEERYAVELVGRHLSLAVRLWFRKRASRHGSESLASSLTAAALIVDCEGRVAWMNHRANSWVQHRRIVLSKGVLAEISGAPLDLPRAIREAAERRIASSVVVAGDLTLELAAVGMPRGRTDPGSGRAVLVLLRDRGGDRQVAAFLAATFRLTSSEVDLAIALWRGVLVAEYAAQRNVAMSTVRSQLKSLLAKTYSRRQSDVVALVARMLPLLGNPSLAATVAPTGSEATARDAPARRIPSNGG